VKNERMAEGPRISASMTRGRGRNPTSMKDAEPALIEPTDPVGEASRSASQGETPLISMGNTSDKMNI